MMKLILTVWPLWLVGLASGQSTEVPLDTTLESDTTVITPETVDLEISDVVTPDSGTNSQGQSQGQGDHDHCFEELIPFDPFRHKKVYKVGVHAIRGLDAAFAETTATFGEYLTATAGARFDPPIEFQVVPLYFEGIFKAIDNEELDFLYSNPGVYSCLGVEVGATSLVTTVRRKIVRDKIFNLDVYGGVIAVRADNKEIFHIKDLKDKIIAAGAIIDLMGGQMQIYELGMAGMSYVNDPKQFVFTKNQDHVVRGLLDGVFDAGFVRTGQIESTTDENGESIDSDLFRIIEPKIYVMDNDDLFPFLHSTKIFPEWPLASLRALNEQVTHEVQAALLKLGEYATVGHEISRCAEVSGLEACRTLEPKDFNAYAPCDTTWEIADKALNASITGNFAGFRTSRSYHELRSMQQQAGFMIEDEQSDGEWYCTRPSNLYEGITCPEGFYKRSQIEFENGCGKIGLTCDNDEEDYDCFCKPCVRAFDVDVYEHIEGEDDKHLTEYYGDELPGCEKMSICGTIEQGQSLTLRIFDNKMRDEADVEVTVHAGDETRQLDVKHLEGTYAYEVTVTDTHVLTQVIDVKVNGKPISQAPIRVMVVERNCKSEFGNKLVANERGECVCSSNTYEMGNRCVDSAYFFLIIFGSVFLFAFGCIMIFLSYKKQQSDSVWLVSVDELQFNQPIEIVGHGAFGVVVLAQYRGTKVAVKRVLPPNRGRGGSKGSMGSIQISGSLDMSPGRKIKESKPASKLAKKDDKGVSFQESADVEAPKPDKDNTSAFLSNRDWESYLMDDHKYNSALRILESATLSGSGQGYGVASTRRSFLSELVPLWMRFDEHSRLRREFQNEMRMLSRLRHPCITTVMGAVIAPRVDPMLVMEFMEYGSLYDLLRNETMYAGGEILLQIIRDITQGINFLHSSRPPILHGDLKAKNILVDCRFRAKVADFGFSQIKTGHGSGKGRIQGTPVFLPPEYLRRKTEYTERCDMYSFGMILYEIYARQDPFEGEDLNKVIPKVCHPRLNKRPAIPEACPPKIADVMKKCWSANPFFRPTAKDVDYVLVELGAKDAEPIETAERKAQSQARKPTSLYDVFPKHIADALNAGKRVEPENHEIVTVVFSDIVGFTTISQTFSPTQVCTMLDRLYNAFDSIAKKHEVFKVETIGDAYMGVTNLCGDQFETHVANVAKYAIDIIAAASKILIDEDQPERGHVKIRVGFHSGPVVSNVIGSLNPRYGLFGDTVNTASRMESNSTVGRIHCTSVSAQLLMQQAPEIPVILRGRMDIKGKGKMITYWVGTPDASQPTMHPDLSEVGSHTDILAGDVDDDEQISFVGEGGEGGEGGDDVGSAFTRETSLSMSESGVGAPSESELLERKINVVSSVIRSHLQKIAATRPQHGTRSPSENEMIKVLEKYMGSDKSLLEKAAEPVVLPQSKSGIGRDPERITLDHKLQEMVHQFVEDIAQLHNNNAFHGFSHAVHVFLSTNRLLDHIQDKEDSFYLDPITRLAAVLGALMHDVDHRGVPNFCLPKADNALHEKYGGKACQEQNSVAVGWEVLMRPEFNELRENIYHTKDEMTRFRQVIVRQVIATEMFDPSLADARLARWEEAFKDESKTPEAGSRKAAAVMEMLIQVADISHIMQSWNRYIKWNHNLFMEMWAAHRKNYLETNPSENWFEGELKFLDTYAIPLATRMADSGVFSTKYLDNVKKNREKWEENGKALINSMTLKMKAEDDDYADAVDLV